MSWRDWLALPYTDEPEEIDEPDQPYPDIVQSMGDVARSNRLLGGTQTVLHHVARLLKNVPPGTPVRILDVATGSGDIPCALMKWGRRRGLDLTVVGVDALPSMLRLADARHCGMSLVQADALALPFPPGSFDIALCALAFHHFGFDASARVLRAMDALTTRGLVVSDLRRDKPTLWGVSTGLTLMRSHPFTLHDGPASVRRAFTPREYVKMVALSGAQNVRLYAHWYARIVLVQEKRQTGEKWV